MLEDKVNVSARLPQANDQTCTWLIIDGMALIQMMKTWGSITFGDLSLVYFNTVTTFYEQYNCSVLTLSLIVTEICQLSPVNVQARRVCSFRSYDIWFGYTSAKTVGQIYDKRGKQTKSV